MPRLWQYQTLAEPLTTDSETITPDKWAPCAEVPQPAWRARAAFSLAALVAVTVLGDVPRAQAITVDRWHPQVEQPLRTARQQQYLYPTIGALDPLPRTSAPETITVDKWFAETQRPRWDARRTQYLYQSFTTDALALTVPERITVDKWFAATELPPMGYRVLRMAHLSPTLSWYTITPAGPVAPPLRSRSLLGVGL